MVLSLSVAGDEDDRPVGELWDALHQPEAVGLAQDQVQQDQVGLLRLDEVREVRVVARDQRDIARLGQRVPDVAQRLRVVIHHEDARRSPHLHAPLSAWSPRRGCRPPRPPRG